MFRKSTVATVALALIALAAFTVVNMQDWLFDSHYRSLHRSISKLESVYKRPDVAAANKTLAAEVRRVQLLRLDLLESGTFSVDEQDRYYQAVVEMEKAYNTVVELASAEIREYQVKSLEFLKYSDPSDRTSKFEYLHQTISKPTELQREALRIFHPGSNAVEKAKERAGWWGITLTAEDLKRSYRDGLLAELKSSVLF